MSVIRRNNWLGQQRADVVDMRAIDSGIAHDFDILAGKMMAGREPLVVRGLTIDTANSVGNPPTSLVLTAAGALVMHYEGAEAGTLLEIPDDQPVDQLFAGNPRVIGGFAANATNYIGIDYLRQADNTTSDQTKFLSANTRQEIAQSVPKGVVLDYRIIISTSPFSLASNICPVAIVVTDGGGNVGSVIDARNLLGRLGAGGDLPNPLAPFIWEDADRRENPNTYAPPTSSANPFSGGDKEIRSFKQWMDAVMSVLWEAKSGEYWYSPTSRDLIKIAYSPNLLGNGTNFDWSAPPTLQWSGIRVIFENSSGTYYNTVSDGSAAISDGQCLYVDINRSTTPAATLTAQVGTLQTLPTPTIPGSRLIIAWRLGAEMYFRDYPFEVGRNLAPVATTTSDGIVRLNATPGAPLHPVVIAVQANGTASNTATGGNVTGFTATGNGTGAGLTGVGGGSAGTGVRGLGTSNGVGGYFEGDGTGNGIVSLGGSAAGTAVFGTGGTGGLGLRGVGGIGTGSGVQGEGTGSGVGVIGVGGATGNGVQGSTAATDGIGVRGEANTGVGAFGVYGITTSGNGVRGISSASNQTGVWGTADVGASAAGVWGDSSSGWGVRGISTQTDKYGVYGTANIGTGAVGVYGDSSGGTGVRGVSTLAGGKGVWGTALTGGVGVYGDGDADSVGVYGENTSSGSGVYGTSSSGTGVYGVSSSSYGVRGVSTSSVGGYFSGTGTGANSGDDAVRVNQNIYLSGDDPASTMGFTNRLTPMNVPKAWGVFRNVANDGTDPTIFTGFNLESVTQSGNYNLVALADDMASGDYCVVVSIWNAVGYTAASVYTSQASGSFPIRAQDASGVEVNLGVTNAYISFVVFGAQ